MRVEGDPLSSMGGEGSTVDRRDFLKGGVSMSAVAGITALAPAAIAGALTSDEPQQLSCATGDYRTSAETQEGVAIRLVEHYIEGHAGELPPLIGGPLHALIEELKAKYH